MMKTEVLARMYRGGAAQRWQRLSGYGSGAEESRSVGLFICRRMLRRAGGSGSSPNLTPIYERWLLATSWQPPLYWLPESEKTCGANRDRTGDLLNAI
jgi:hypothetical protein